MKLRPWLVVLAVAMLAVFMAPQEGVVKEAAPVAQLPTWEVGQTWVFESRGVRIPRTVKEVKKDVYVVEVEEPGGTKDWIYSKELRVLQIGDNKLDAPHDMKFPMAVGNEWEGKHVWPRRGGVLWAAAASSRLWLTKR